MILVAILNLLGLILSGVAILMLNRRIDRLSTEAFKAEEKNFADYHSFKEAFAETEYRLKILEKIIPAEDRYALATNELRLRSIEKRITSLEERR